MAAKTETTSSTAGALVRRLSPMQRHAAKFMAASRAETVEVTICAEIDVTALVALRDEARIETGGATVTHYLIAALARALCRHPEFDAHFADNALQLLGRTDIGIAISLENGDLITPVLTDAAKLSLVDIATKTRALRDKAQAKKLNLADTRGAGFTLSSVGASPTPKFATPVVPVPQVGILAATAIRDAPVVAKGSIELGSILPVSLSFDHRAVNGFAANAFLETLAAQLAEPSALLGPGSRSKEETHDRH